ncbi:MAG: hypothetical protein U0324_02965 [Polyangiales bacterium]
MRPPRRRRAPAPLVLAALALARCEPAPVTQVVIRLQASDPATAARLHFIHLRAARETSLNAIAEADLPPAGERLPGDVGVIPDDPGNTLRLVVFARGMLDDGTSLEQRASVRFVPDHKTLLVLDFHRGCASLSCGPAQTCDADPMTGQARCRSIVRELPDYTPLVRPDAAPDVVVDAAPDAAPDASSDALDDAVPDASIDASVDAAPEDVAPWDVPLDFPDARDAGAFTPTEVGRVACGERHCCRVTAGATVQCWGSGADGRLGNGNENLYTVASDVVGLRDVVQVAAGEAHSCALTRDGRVWCWGRGDRGQLGQGTLTGSLVPVVARITDVAQLSSRHRHVCVVRRDGSTWCWGDNEHAQLFMTAIRPTDVVRIPTFRPALRVAAGWGSSCVVDDEHAVECWGDNSSPLGQAAEPGVPSLVYPRDVAARAVDLSVGPEGACVAYNDGTVACWGTNRQGQVGDGTTTPRLAAVAVPDLLDVVQVTVGPSHTCARLREGLGACWGTDDRGELGQGSAGVQRLRPAMVIRLARATELAAGSDTVCVQRDDGMTHCWGRNDDGEVGDRTQTDRSAPTPVQSAP